MTLRVLTAGLLVGVLGLAGLAAAFAVEHFAINQVRPFLAAHPETFPLAPNTGLLALLVATLWLGVAFAYLYDRAFAKPPGLLEALAFG